MKANAIITSIFILLSFLVIAAAPPALINYQGVLRDAAGAPQTGDFDMVFRFYNVSSSGTLLLTDTHNAASPSGQVAASNGLFTSQLGAGTITAGSEPDLAEMFRDNAAVWLEVQVGAETMSPRVQVLASAYAQNAGSLQGVVNVSGTDTGIGTPSPDRPLTVQGSGPFSELISLKDAGGTTKWHVNLFNGGLNFTETGVSLTRLFLKDGGNVGIGSISPAYRLDVAGDARITGALRDSSGNAGASGQLLQSNGTGLQWVDQSSTSDGDWTVSGSDMFSAVSGSVGIGTASPLAKLHVEGPFQVRGFTDSQLDQEQAVCGYYGNWTTAWQSFTAGRTGYLSMVSFRTKSPLNSGGYVTGTLKIYEGEGPAGTLLSSNAITIGGGWIWRNFNLASDIPVTAGATYTWSIVLPLVETSWYCFAMSNPYAGGVANPGPDYDFTFRTYIGSARGPALSVAPDARVGIGTTVPEKALQIGDAGTPNAEGMVRLSSRSGTGGAQRTWDIGVPETEDEVTGKGYSFVIDDTQLGANPEFMVQYGSGNVGIGTITPNMPLTVKSNSVGDLLSLKDNLDANQWHLKYTGGLNFVESGVAEYRLYLQDGGRVGIGTSTPGFPLTFPNTLGDKISLWGQSGNHFGFGIQSSLLQVHTSDSSADIAFGHGSSAAMTETMRIKGNGNVGIGTNIPAFRLEVAGDARITGALRDSSGDAGTDGQVLKSTAGGTDWIDQGAINDGDWTVLVNDMYSNVSGNVGIGTTSPQAKLQVDGQFLVRGYTDSQLDQQQTSFDRAGAPTAIWQSFTAGRTGYLAALDIYLMSFETGGADGTATLRIYSGEGTGGTLLTTGAIVLKGSSYSWQRFDIPGNVAVSSGSKYTYSIQAPYANTSWPAMMGFNPYPNGTSSPWSDCDYPFQTYIGTTLGPALSVSTDAMVGIGLASASYKLQLATDSAAKPSTNTWTVPSDKRLKKDIAPFTDGLEVLERIDPVRYRYNGLAQLPTDEENIGIVAQDIRLVAPYTIRSYKARLKPRDVEDTELLGFNSHALTFILINAVKELDERTKGLAGQDGKERITRKLSAGPKPLDGKERWQPGEPVPDTPAQPAVPTGAAIQMLPAIEGVEPGDVLVLNPANGDELYKCNLAADPMVVGVAALISGATAGGQAPVVTSGVTLVKADALHGSITKGDLLVASPTPGHAMKMGAFVPGTVIGKALEDLPAGTGLIRVVVMLR